jgi:hypothetical protein
MQQCNSSVTEIARQTGGGLQLKSVMALCSPSPGVLESEWMTCRGGTVKV